MKLAKRFKTVVAIMLLSLISLTCFACAGVNVEFKFKKELPTEVLYGNELYFKDYIPREFGREYVLTASYYDADQNKEIVDEVQDSLVFTFDKVTDYDFKITRDEEDVLECSIKCMPEIPKFSDKTLVNAKLGKELKIANIVFEAFGSMPLKNREMAEVDPDYEIKATRLDIRSVDVNGEDQLDYDFKSKTSIVLDKDASYEFTFTASNRAGSVDHVVTFSTSDSASHTTSLNGYVLENGNGLTDNDLYFTVPGMPEAEDEAVYKVRYGATKADKSNVYDAVYDKYTGKFKVEGFDQEVDGEGRLYVKDVKNDKNYSTYITVAQLINQENAATLPLKSDGYFLLTEDLDFADIPVDWKDADVNVFSGTLDGNGYSIKNLHATSITNEKGEKIDVGTGLFKEMENAIVKNVTFEDAIVSTGLISLRTLGENVIENVVAEIKKTTGTRASLIGYHVDAKLATTLRNVVVDVTAFTPNSYFGAVSTHAGGNCIIDNLFIIGGVNRLHSVDGNHSSYIPNHRGESIVGGELKKVDAKLGEHYYASNSAEDVYYSYAAGETPERIIEILEDLEIIKRINEDNFACLQTITSGYLILEEDIDLANVDVNGDGQVNSSDLWAPSTSVKFSGTLNGNNKTVKNLKFASGNYKGLIGITGTGATIRNLTVRATVSQNYAAALMAQTKGDTLVENVVIELEKLSGYSSSTVTTHVESGALTLRNVLVNVKEVVADNCMGYITAQGNTAASKVILDDVFVCVPAGLQGLRGITNGGAISLTAHTYNTDGGAAVQDEDFVLAGGIVEIERTDLPTDYLKSAYDRILDSFTYTEINSINIETLLNATSGYYILTEDIDMTKYQGTWNPSANFKGVLNGNEHKLYNFKGKGSNYNALLHQTQGAIIKNLTMEIVSHGYNLGAALISQVKGASSNVVTRVENVYLDYDKFSSYNGGGVACHTEGRLSLRNVVLEANQVTASGTKMGLLTGSTNGATYNVALENVIIYTSNPEFTTIGIDATYLSKDLAAAKLGRDYFVYTDKLDMDLDVAMPTTLLQNAYAARVNSLNPVKINNQNIDLLLTANSGYYMLTEDVDLAGKTWVSSADFNGTLNGKGYSIFNLDLSAENSTALFERAAGTIKNLELHVNSITQCRSALFNSNPDDITISNVVINVGKVDTNDSGIIAQTFNSNVTLNNVLIFAADVNLVDGAKILAPTGTGTATMNGVYMIVGSNSPVYGGTIGGTKDADYFLFDTISEMLAANVAGDIVLDKYVMNGVSDLKIAVALNNKNFTDLASATTGFWYLTENIDMEGMNYVPSSTFLGAFDGNGYEIKNYKAKSLFKEFAGTASNVAIKGDSIGSGDSIFGKIVGDTVINGMVVRINTLNGTAIAGEVNANLIINDAVTVVKFGNSKALVGTVQDGKKVVVSKVAIIGAKDDESVGELSNATGTAVKGQDYFVYESAEKYIDDRLSSKLVSGAFTFSKLESLGVVKEIRQDNAADIKKVAEGYVYLKEDIDLSTFAEWNDFNTIFSGTFDGRGHSITNVNNTKNALSGFLYELKSGSVIKNLSLSGKNTGNNSALLVAVIRENCTIENVFLYDSEHSAYAGGILAKSVCERATDVKINNVVIAVNSSKSNNNNGLLFGTYSTSVLGKVTLNGVTIIDLATGTEKITQLSNGLVEIVGEPNIVTSVDANLIAGLPTEFLKTAVQDKFGA